MKFRWRSLLIVIGIVIAVILLVDFNRRMEELNRLSAQLKAVGAEATAVIQTQTALAGQVAYATSVGAVEDWAYQNKMVRPGEHPIVLVPESNVTATPEVASLEKETHLPNWRIWFELFFGAQP
jgi:hypothetical protein